MLLLKNVIFTLLVPGTVAVFVPYRILTSSGRLHLHQNGVARFLGIALILFGGALYLWCVWGFGHVGQGTPAPIDPPKKLVVSGPYRLTRNPMYAAVLSVIVGESVWFSSGRLLWYALVVLAAFYTFVVFYEEPTLRRQFGRSYESYCTRVPRWLFRRKVR